MTNTHITIGGHKITTNKVGSAHTITLSVSGTAYYVVQNGICFIYMTGVAASTSSTWSTIATGVPPNKCNLGELVAGSTNVFRVNGTSLQIFTKSSSSSQALYVYPVADDWSE